jgi:hypothetical protein
MGGGKQLISFFGLGFDFGSRINQSRAPADFQIGIFGFQATHKLNQTGNTA